MATSKEYFDFVKDSLSHISGIEYVRMMGEYIIYHNGNGVGGIYDDRLLVRATAAAKEMMPDAKYEEPYTGGKPMILVERLEDPDFMEKLITTAFVKVPFRKGENGR